MKVFWKWKHIKLGILNTSFAKSLYTKRKKFFLKVNLTGIACIPVVFPMSFGLDMAILSERRAKSMPNIILPKTSVLNVSAIWVEKFSKTIFAPLCIGLTLIEAILVVCVIKVCHMIFLERKKKRENESTLFALTKVCSHTFDAICTRLIILSNAK